MSRNQRLGFLGIAATGSFKASITGIFEVELEQSAEQLAEPRVNPD